MPNNIVIQVRLPDEELAEVQKRAKAKGIAPAAWTKELIYKELGLPPPGPERTKALAQKVAKAITANDKPKKVAKKTTTAKKKATADANPQGAKEGEAFAAPASATSPQVMHGTVDIDPDKPQRRTASVTLPDPRLTVGIPTERAASTSKCQHPKAQLKKFSWGSVCGVCNTRVR